MTATKPRKRRSKATVAGPPTIVALAFIAWLAYSIFGVQTLFTNAEVSETQPIFSSGAGASGLPSDAIRPELAAAMTQAMADDDLTVTDETGELPPGGAEVITVAVGDFVDRSHPTEGQAVVLSDGTEQRFLRFEDFRTDNGPDLVVWLSTAPSDAPAGDFDDDFVSLGELKGNVGPQNYEIPADVDLERYQTVLVWCRRFGVAFGAAPLN